ncbi:MAG: hypothetical protein AAGB24_09535 [Bacteroidota bacterium]
MKAVFTIIAVVFFGFVAVAQSANEIKVPTKTMEIELNIEIQDTKEVKSEVARLYKYKNSRIKKALNFRTKRNRSKLA